VRGIGAPAARADVRVPGEFELDVAGGRAIARQPGIELTEHLRLCIEPMRIAIEDDRHRRRLGHRQLLDGIECEAVAVQPTHDIERVADDLVPLGQCGGVRQVVDRADPARAPVAG
jgi:hypothetical protein